MKKMLLTVTAATALFAASPVFAMIDPDAMFELDDASEKIRLLKAEDPYFQAAIQTMLATAKLAKKSAWEVSYLSEDKSTDPKVLEFCDEAISNIKRAYSFGLSRSEAYFAVAKIYTIPQLDHEVITNYVNAHNAGHQVFFIKHSPFRTFSKKF